MIPVATQCKCLGTFAVEMLVGLPRPVFLHRPALPLHKVFHIVLNLQDALDLFYMVPFSLNWHGFPQDLVRARKLLIASAVGLWERDMERVMDTPGLGECDLHSRGGDDLGDAE